MPKQKQLCLDWQPHKAELQNLYLVQDQPLEQLMRYMEETHGFRATKAQFETQLRKWNFRKNLTKEEWNYALLQMRKRKFDGKESDVYLNDRIVPEKRVKKEMSRHFTLTQTQLFDAMSIPSTPEAITVSTPNATASAAGSDIILYNLPYFQFQALLQPAAPFDQISPVQATLIWTPQKIALDSHDWDAPALFQKIASSSDSTSNEGGQMLLAKIFGPEKVEANGHSILSQIRSDMLVSSLEKYDGELLERLQLFCGPPRQSSVLQILQFALYRLSNNLLSESSTDELLRWLIEQQKIELLTSFLKIKMPTVHACATKILESALRIQDANFLQLLIDSGVDLSPLKGVYGSGYLVSAAYEGDMQTAQILLKNGADVNIPSDDDLIALQAAAFNGHANLVQVFLKAGANVDAVSPYEECYTALSQAVENDDIELVRILLTAGANIDSCKILNSPAIEHSAIYTDNDELHYLLLSASSKGYSSITVHGVSEAASKGTQALSKYLAEKGGSRSLVRKVLKNALKSACRNDHSAAIPILDIGVDLDYLLPCNLGGPLIEAVRQENFELIKTLLRAGADINTPHILDSTIECDKGDDSVINMLQFMLEEGADIKTQGKGALKSAAYHGNLEVVQYLISAGVDVNAQTNGFTDRTILQNAVLSRNIGLVKILLKAGSDVNATCRMREETALETAVRFVAKSGPERLEIVQVLLAAGADVNPPKGNRLLQSAIFNGDEELACILLDKGADVNSFPKGREGRSPVQDAAERGNLSFVKLLLKSGANINASPSYYHGRTAIQAASSAFSPTMELIDFLLDTGAEMNAPPAFYGGVTALQGAAIRGHMKIALKFLEAGADVNAAAATVNGRTALDGAAEHGRLDMVQMLLNAGACGDSSKVHRFDEAIELAQKNGHFAVANLLESA